MNKKSRFILCTFCTLMLLSSYVVDAKADSFTVFAYDNSSTSGIGLDTGIDFVIDDMFTVNVDPNDLWNAGPLPRWSNADGLITNLYSTGSDESGQPANTLIGQPFDLFTMNGFTAPYGALVGKILNTYFLIGTSFSGPAPSTGRLMLYYWDSNNGDNTDQLTRVNVNVGAVPEPATMLLLGFGLIGLAGVRRKFKK